MYGGKKKKIIIWIYRDCSRLLPVGSSAFDGRNVKTQNTVRTTVSQRTNNICVGFLGTCSSPALERLGHLAASRALCLHPCRGPSLLDSSAILSGTFSASAGRANEPRRGIRAPPTRLCALKRFCFRSRSRPNRIGTGRWDEIARVRADFPSYAIRTVSKNVTFVRQTRWILDKTYDKHGSSVVIGGVNPIAGTVRVRRYVSSRLLFSVTTETIAGEKAADGGYFRRKVRRLCRRKDGRWRCRGGGAIRVCAADVVHGRAGCDARPMKNLGHPVPARVVYAEIARLASLPSSRRPNVPRLVTPSDGAATVAAER